MATKERLITRVDCDWEDVTETTLSELSDRNSVYSESVYEDDTDDGPQSREALQRVQSGGLME
jgi:hypothetical protein